MKIIIAPDSFKGTLTSKEVADIIAEEVALVFPECEIIKMPIADGGEGSVDVILSAVGGEIYSTEVLSPDDRLIEAYYGIANNGTVIMEMAQSSGITKQNCLHPMTSTTYGFGQMILNALNTSDGIADDAGLNGENDNINEIRYFNLCIGGSATTDGGCGMAAALGVKFFNKQGGEFIPSGETLIDIDKIDTTGLDKRITKCNFTVMCDVDNPLYGTNGAAYVYGPQKGANPDQIVILDAGLRHYGAILEKHFGKDFADIPGAGGAGGLGAGCLAFLNAEIQSGINAILNIYDFKEQCKDADLVITGEGKLDSQSFQGKVLSGILRESGNVPVWSICGICDYGPEELNEKSVTGTRSEPVIVFEISEGIPQDENIKEPGKHLRAATKKAMKILTN